ncbi:MAG: hypothetical protein WAV13_01205 [Thermodesulfovibrionales bacterium]
MDLVKNLCENFCAYYKPSKDEDLACRGFVVVKRLIKTGKPIPFEKSSKRPGTLAEEDLKKILCPACAFYDGDCDFILRENDASPCGGFIFLSLLLDSGVICIDDVRNIE